MLETWRNEFDNVPYIYDVSELSSHLKISPPPIEDLVNALSGIGNASRTHVSPTSFKTDLDLKDIISVYRDVPRE